MSTRVRAGVAIAAVAVLVAACGGNGGNTDPTAPGATTTTSGGSGSSTVATTTPASGGDEGSATVTIDGTTYELSTRNDIPIGVGSVMVPTRCEPDFFGRGQFWVIAVAIDADGNQAVPQVSLELSLFPTIEDAEAADEALEFNLQVDPPDGSAEEEFDYLIANDEQLTLQNVNFAGDLGSWSIEGNRIYGEVAVYEYDHVREFFTATFDITCPG